MGILNYSTQISTSKTVGEIQATLAKAGAKSIIIDYDDGDPVTITFYIRVANMDVNFRLPSNFEGTYQVILDDKSIPKSFKTLAQARRVSWRITKDWIEAQLAIIEAGQASLQEVFLPYLIIDGGRTLYQALTSGNGNFQLPSGL